MESALPAAGFLYWLGAGTVAYLALRVSCSLFTAFWLWVVGNEAGVSLELGEWAVVTGSTDGIGKSYAEELAKRGMKVVLVSRSQDKLNQVSSEIREQFKVETRTIAVDFSSEDIYDKIKTGLAGLEIGVLVNNVGMSYEYPEYFLEIPDLDNVIKKLININILSVCKDFTEEKKVARGTPAAYLACLKHPVVMHQAIAACLYEKTNLRKCMNKFEKLILNLRREKMTQLVLPGMVERSKGVILNISSASGMSPVPLLTIYSATKAFVDFFSRCLHEEYRSKGIFVQSVLPYYVATKMSKIRKPTLGKPSPSTFVKSALKTVGLKSRTCGYLVHALMASFTLALPSWIYFKIAMNMNKAVRAHFLKKNKKN